ncbi:hypothetical protein F0U62_16990 [Cystobacter fuscus]|uniref:hypothetical protein n=1 Tax=Cystobacter fuscus TaxID=43 RepID=UPI002B2D0C23|nr:hypothetical protein F0U62_16990 [Cystobacter fuscus]
MSLFVSVFCQSAEPIRAKDLFEFVKEGSYFENPPSVTTSPPNSDTMWTRIDIDYDPGERPVSVYRVEKSDIAEHVEEAIDELREANLVKTQSALVKKLKKSREVFALEIDPVAATDDCWEMVSSLEAWLARERNGVVYAPNDGFFDGELNRICDLPE